MEFSRRVGDLGEKNILHLRKISVRKEFLETPLMLSSNALLTRSAMLQSKMMMSIWYVLKCMMRRLKDSVKRETVPDGKLGCDLI